MTDTVYGWDTSSHDSTPTSLDGLSFFSCKLTDGDHYYENPTFAAKMNAMRGFGCPVLGAYHVLWGNYSIQNQVTWFLQRLDATIPWWRSFPFFICQSDDEPFYSGQTTPTIDQVNQFHDLVAAQSDKITAVRNFAYAPSWVYGSNLTKLRYRWWSSNYGTNPTGHYPAIYPGNGSAQWNGPITPFFLQYSSNAIIAGQSTSDANAYRGTLDQLKAVLGISEGGDVTYRIKFDSSIPGADTTHFYLTDLVTYRIQPISYQVDNAVNALLGKTTVDLMVTSAYLPANWSFAQLVSALCGVPAGTATGGGAVADHEHTTPAVPAGTTGGIA